MLALRSTRAVVSTFCVLGLGSWSVLSLWPTAIASHPASLDLAKVRDASIPLSTIIESISVSISDSVDKHDDQASHTELGLNIGSMSPDDYRRHLEAIYSDFFASSRQHAMEEVLNYLSLLPRRREAMPRNIYTTDLGSPDQLPDQFDSWTTVNPDWTTLFVSDDNIDVWLESKFAAAPDESGVKLEMAAMKEHHGVVRADLFRYLVLLLEGGVYTDTDTACVRPIGDWGQNPDRHPLFPLEAALPGLLAISSSVTTDSSVVPASDQGEPSLIVSIEVDAPFSGTDWRKETFARGIQIVQWTLAARPFHPVLLDVAGHALSTAKRIREALDTGEEQSTPEILDWSGPGAFTDAVMRYLLVRYGIHPNSLSRLTRPTRFGDVLVMPIHSFRADASEGFQGDHRVVWHGFYGRWKHKD